MYLNKPKIILTTQIAIFFICSLFQINAIATEQLQQQRNNFVLAKTALDTNKTSTFYELSKKLKGYPLKPYLDYLYLSHRLSQVSAETIEAFLVQEKGTFYAERLRNKWLNTLARQKKWSLFLEQYQAPQSAARQCLRLQALIKTGQKTQALEQTKDLWLVPRSQNKNCDPAFKYWQDNNQLTDDIRWQRIMLAVKQKQYSLAKYIAKSLKNPSPAKVVITNWQQANNSPEKYLKTKISDTSSNREIIKHALTRLARKSPEKAYDVWLKIRSKYNFAQQDIDNIRGAIGLRAALNRQDRTLEFFGDTPNQPWRVRAALWQQDWPAVNKAVLSLEPHELSKTRWQYWLARSQAEMGENEKATETYQSLIGKRDYYGFLAADKLQQPYQMNHNPIYAEQTELDAMLQRPAIARLKEFYSLKMGLEARRQAYYLQQKMSPRELQLLATLTHQWQWHNQTIALLGKAKYWDAIDLRFPVLYDKPVKLAANKNNLNPSWILAIARQESAFNPHARSHVGATGLMQLMPKTAKQTGRLINKPLKNKSELLVPARNIELGSAYLRLMYDKNKQNPVLATASYNAGPHRVAKWLPKKPLPADIWVENIPFNETRRYVQSVMSYAAIFDYQRKQTIKPLSDRMPAVQAKTK